LNSQGEGVFQNYSKTVEWYRKAADQGYPRAQYNLDDMYANGLGVLKDRTKAKYWIK